MKIAVFYYSQSGQAYEAAKNMFRTVSDESSPLAPRPLPIITYKEICPLEEYPFPWSSYEFFDTFPETRLGLPPSGIHPIDFSDIEDADVVVIVGQSWFLSPSLPLQSFFADEQVKAFLSGKNVVFVNVCRNMWLMTARRVKDYLKEIHANLVGHIVLQDRQPNLVSGATIIRWLFYGRKDATGLMPAAGVSEKDMMGASRLGEIIVRSSFSTKAAKPSARVTGVQELQEQLLAAGAIDYKPSILRIEKVGHRVFRIWANFIRKKGGFRDVRRKGRVRMFHIYIVSALFLVSPIVQLFFYLTYPIQQVRKNKQIDCSVK